MIYSALFDIIKSTAESVNASGSFIHGRRLDITLGYPETFPQIHLLPSITNVDSPVESFDTTNVLMGFFGVGGQELSPDQSKDIIADSDVLARAFRTALMLVNGIDVTSFRIEPAYNLYAGVMTGVSVSFNVISKTPSC